jgi:hypothetical protein
VTGADLLGKTDADRDTRAVLAVGLAFSLLILASPLLPCVDLPQHVAMSAQLARVWAGDPETSRTFVANAATHNAGFHLFVAALSRLLPAEVGARLFVALYPPIFLGSIAAWLRSRDLPPARALVAAPAVLGFSFGWGFANFCMGTALGFLALAMVSRQLEAPRWQRALALSAVSVLLGLTHVMAMLLTAVAAAAMGLEHVVRSKERGRAVQRTVLGGAPLVLGCAYDVWVAMQHLAEHAGSYTSPVGAAEEPAWWRKVWALGSLVAGLFGTFADTVLAWVAIGVVLCMIFAAARRKGVGGAPMMLPAIALFAAYLAVPSVFANTHLVFQRLAQWVLAAALVAVPLLRADLERSLRRAGYALSVMTLAVAAAHLAWFGVETAPLRSVLAAVPPGARVIGYMETTRTASVRVAAISQAAAYAVGRGALDEGFSFARFMGMPLRYRPEALVAPPSPTFEHGRGPYPPLHPFVRAFPFLIVRTAMGEESNENLARRLFGEHADKVRVVAREGDVALFDTRSLGEHAGPAPGSTAHTW